MISKLFKIFILTFFFCSKVLAASSWFEIKLDNNTSKHWNLKKAEEIAPYKFKIPSATLKTQDRMDYEAFLIEKMVPYCSKPKGKYKEPEIFLMKGKPTTTKRAIQFIDGVEERLWKEYKEGKTKKKPGLTLEEFQFEWFGNYVRRSERMVSYEIPYVEFSGSIFIFCTTKIENKWKDDYSQSNEKLVIAENIRYNNEERIIPDYYDCRNRKTGIDLDGEPFWTPQPVKKNTYAEMYLNKICEQLK